MMLDVDRIEQIIFGGRKDPKGKPRRLLQLPDIPEGAEDTCRNCPDARACPNVSTCCGGKLSVHIVVPCPRGKWVVSSGQKTH
jgi:hypothetical protein